MRYVVAVMLSSILFVSVAKAYEPPPENIGVLITALADVYNVDSSLALRIAYCESRWDYQADHFNENKTHDGGLFQINDIHLPEMGRLGLRREIVTDNVIYAMILLTRNGTRDFSPSRFCWNHVII